MDEQQISEGLKMVHDEIIEAATKVNRPAGDIKLLLATKTVDAGRIKIAVDAGEHLIGENKVQEYTEKFEAIKSLPCERHFIGHLQTNKIREVLKYVSCIQSVDRVDLVEKLDKRLQLEGRAMDIFVQVNTSYEESKFGIAPEDFFSLLKTIKPLDTLHIKGLMTIGLLSEKEIQVKKSYRLLRELRDNALSEGLLPETAVELSMGMSNDLEWAIEEGSTMVRVGSAIFGKRNYTV